MDDDLFVEEHVPVQSPVEAAPDKQQSNEQPNSPSQEVPESLEVENVAAGLRLKDFGDSTADKDLPYITPILRDMLQQDTLLVMGRGLGADRVLKAFFDVLRDIGGLFLVLGGSLGEMPGVTELTATSTPASKREILYAEGGIFNLSPQICIVDALTGVLDASKVGGIVIVRAERINELSGEAFAVKLLRKSNRNMFVRALSQDPERLARGDSLGMRLRSLGVQTISLWPRFHVLIDQGLPKLNVEEVIIEQPEIVRRMQTHLSELMQSTLSDIKRRVPHLDLYFVDETSLDTLLSTPNLHWRIRSSLMGVWHKLSWAGKQSVASLATLQGLLECLGVYDPLSFWHLLQAARRDTNQAWLHLAAADALYVEARERLRPPIEPPSKWTHLREILKEWRDKRVLVACQSRRTLHQLREWLWLGDEYFAAQLKPRQTSGAPSSEPSNTKHTSKHLKQEDTDIGHDESSRSTLPPPAPPPTRGSRRRVRGGSHAATNTRKRPEPENDDTLETVFEPVIQPQLDQADPQYTETLNLVGADVTLATYRALLEGDYGASRRILNELNPDCVIMYDPDLRFTREMEVWSALGGRAEIIFMYYQQSVEELRYLQVMREEKDAFTKLIREKGLMPMVLGDETVADEDGASEVRLVPTPGDHRRYDVAVGRPKVVVDVREFRSALPYLIWQNRMDLVPLTLKIGDYILTPDIVVERKSLVDLISSFRSGRLYGQCEQMFRYYKTGVLLIEFENAQSFNLEPFQEIRARTTATTQREIQENLVTLLVTYPELRILWSASPQHTAELFWTLKSQQPDPDPTKCAEAGHEVLFDSVALDLLEAMPGIDRRNARLVAERTTSLRDLVDLGQTDLSSVIGREAAIRLSHFMDESLDNAR